MPNKRPPSPFMVQQRMVSAMEQIAREHGRDTVALFSHGDPIRLALAHFLGMPIDFIHRLQISPASVSAVDFTSDGVRVAVVNRRAEPGDDFTG